MKAIYIVWTLKILLLLMMMIMITVILTKICTFTMSAVSILMIGRTMTSIKYDTEKQLTSLIICNNKNSFQFFIYLRVYTTAQRPITK
jgi:hypothetical protein